MKAELYMSNTTAQTVAAGGTIGLGVITRRFGNTKCCTPVINAGNGGVVLNAPGYYRVFVNVTVEPTAEGPVTVALYQDGVAYPAAVATNTAGVASAATSVCVPADVKVSGCAPSTLTVVLLDGAGSVTNVGVGVVKL